MIKGWNALFSGQQGKQNIQDYRLVNRVEMNDFAASKGTGNGTSMEVTARARRSVSRSRKDVSRSLYLRRPGIRGLAPRADQSAGGSTPLDMTSLAGEGGVRAKTFAMRI